MFLFCLVCMCICLIFIGDAYPFFDTFNKWYYWCALNTAIDGWRIWHKMYLNFILWKILKGNERKKSLNGIRMKNCAGKPVVTPREQVRMRWLCLDCGHTHDFHAIFKPLKWKLLDTWECIKSEWTWELKRKTKPTLTKINIIVKCAFRWFGLVSLLLPGACWC